jgi:hypothetical protein
MRTTTVRGSARAEGLFEHTISLKLRLGDVAGEERLHELVGRSLLFRRWPLVDAAYTIYQVDRLIRIIKNE